jgi:predicted dehydrogenase
VISQVGHHGRFRKSVLRLKELAADGKAGKPTLFEGRFWCNFPGGAWWREKSRSGGQIYEQVIHLYDLALHLLGTPERATGFIANICHKEQADYTIDDTSIGTIRFSNGSMATITGSNCAIPDHFIFDFRVIFEKAVLDYRSTGDWRITDESTLFLTSESPLVREDFKEDGDPYKAETGDFLNAIRTRGTTLTPARQGLETIRLVTAVMKSAASNGKPVKISHKGAKQYAEVR